MRILVTFAVEAEFAPWMKLRRFQEKQLQAEHWSGGFRVYETMVADHAVWVHLTGMGGRSKGLFPLALCAKAAGTDFVISSGLAGSLRKEHSVREVIAPHRVGTLRDATGATVNSDLHRLAGEHGAKLVETMLTSDHIVESVVEKTRLGNFADAVDMESKWIMEEFAGEDIPIVTIRAISDESDEDLPLDFTECLTQEGKLRPVSLLKSLIKKPAKVPDLVRFGIRSKKAAANLAQFLDSFCAAVTPQYIKRDLGAIAE